MQGTLKELCIQVKIFFLVKITDIIMYVCLHLFQETLTFHTFCWSFKILHLLQTQWEAWHLLPNIPTLTGVKPLSEYSVSLDIHTNGA